MHTSQHALFKQKYFIHKWETETLTPPWSVQAMSVIWSRHFPKLRLWSLWWHLARHHSMSAFTFSMSDWNSNTHLYLCTLTSFISDWKWNKHLHCQSPWLTPQWTNTHLYCPSPWPSPLGAERAAPYLHCPSLDSFHPGMKVKWKPDYPLLDIFHQGLEVKYTPVLSNTHLYCQSPVLFDLHHQGLKMLCHTCAAHLHDLCPQGLKVMYHAHLYCPSLWPSGPPKINRHTPVQCTVHPYHLHLMQALHLHLLHQQQKVKHTPVLYSSPGCQTKHKTQVK